MRRTVVLLTLVLVVVAALGLITTARIRTRQAPATPAPREDSSALARVVYIVEGEVLDKDIVNTRAHKAIKASANAEENKQREEAKKTNRYRAEFTVRVVRWLEGEGPEEIILVRGLRFAKKGDPRPQAYLSTDWSEEQFSNILEVGKTYRMSMTRDLLLDGPYYLLADVLDENGLRVAS